MSDINSANENHHVTNISWIWLWISLWHNSVYNIYDEMSRLVKASSSNQSPYKTKPRNLSSLRFAYHLTLVYSFLLTVNNLWFLNRSYLEWNECLNIKTCKYFVANESSMGDFHPLEVVGHGSETQLQARHYSIPHCVFLHTPLPLLPLIIGDVYSSSQFAVILCRLLSLQPFLCHSSTRVFNLALHPRNRYSDFHPLRITKVSVAAHDASQQKRDVESVLF